MAHLLAAHGKIAKFLLENGADVNLPDGENWTPLHYAVLNGEAETTLLLLESGADPTLPNPNGKTAFEIAQELRNVECMKALISFEVQHKIWLCWLLETPEYTSHVQWLPKEMVEDTLTLLRQHIHTSQIPLPPPPPPPTPPPEVPIEFRIFLGCIAQLLAYLLYTLFFE